MSYIKGSSMLSSMGFEVVVGTFILNNYLVDEQVNTKKYKLYKGVK